MPEEIQADRLAAEELRVYNQSAFDLSALGPQTVIPLADELFVSIWETWAEEARGRGAFTVLREHLPQLGFPIREGISQTEAYRAATRRGIPPDSFPEATGLALEHPERIELVLYPSPAGRIPLLIARGRAEFAALVQALARRNEPVPVPDSQGALMISGYNNWERLHGLRRRWEALDPEQRETATWSAELARIQPQRELYQDRFILLSDGPYSAVPAADLGLDEASWREMSLVIRRDHECAHYFTRRLFGSMRNNVLDELIADYTGIVAAIGRFRADWFLRFIGARLEMYRGDPPLSDGAFRILQGMVKAAAENLERFDARLPSGPRTLEQRSLMIAALASLRLDEIASSESLLAEAVDRVRSRLGRRSAHGPGTPA